MKTGKVWLVGAGPSDAGLLTLKGKQVLEDAEVVVYDRLVGQGILSMMPPEAEQIDVGKTSGNHPVPQEEINQILLRKAQEGKRVVRLKGGDSFLFGRGGEELELLCEHNIPFEVVPGITSAISVPAYAGIPVTHRDFCSSVHIITAHLKRGSNRKPDYAKLVGLDGTLVFLMGVSSLGEIQKGLLDAGMDPEMPAAILERGTTAKQRRVVSTLQKLPEEAAKAQIQSPAIIVVGKVCVLADQFHWAEDRPLGGARVIVTRPKTLASGLVSKLRALGAEVVEMPVIRTQRLADQTAAWEAIRSGDRYSWLVFTSAAGVDAFFALLAEQHLDIRALAGKKIAVIGSGTGKALAQRGVFADYIPAQYSGAALAEGLAEQLTPTDRLLLLRAKETPPTMADILTAHGAAFDNIPIYETVYTANRTTTVEPDDFVAFTSASTVKGFVGAMGDIDYSRITAVCIGAQTEREAAKYGMRTVVSEQATIDSLIECIKTCYQNQKRG